MLSSFVVVLVGTTFLVQNNYYSSQTRRTLVQDNARIATELMATEVRSAMGVGFVTAGARTMTVRSPMVLGVVCNRTGSGTADVHSEGGPTQIDTGEIAGVGARDAATGTWTYANAAWGTIAGSSSTSAAACAANGADTVGASAEYYRLTSLDALLSPVPSEGDVVMLFRETTFEIRTSAMDNTGLGLFRAAYGGLGRGIRDRHGYDRPLPVQDRGLDLCRHDLRDRAGRHRRHADRRGRPPARADRRGGGHHLRVVGERRPEEREMSSVHPVPVSHTAEPRRGGFVLAFVVFMLFAVSVAAATGYVVVNAEFNMAQHATHGAEALAVARAGLERFIAEESGVVGDSVSYALGDGVALITTRKVFSVDSLTDVYHVRSEGTVADLFAPNTPARRVVAAYATHRRRPLAHHAVLMISSQEINADNSGTIHGFDHDTALQCAGGGAASITGGIARVAVTEDSPSQLQGSPEGEVWAGGYTQMLDSIGLRWDVLSDLDFPVEFDDVWPNWGSLPADSFPLVRRTGWTTANGVHGRGVLIVVGMFDGGSNFSWDGIIIAQDVDDYIEGDLRGLLVGGLNANNFYNTIWWRGDAEYHSCNVYKANETLSYLELVENTVYETF